ncbi:MAG: MATE family efflux transporter [Fusobacterium sp.]|uniref:MATE family efflux transporter n=1 Tax=Fusobacterium sp. TaxID=68766 RepID=UPI0026DC8D03|nr:MATE family efflux transporter [Fusobacterium sp.]MDO4690163.1 MATE family efflux transporter [Fusobacterium sp.]
MAKKIQLSDHFSYKHLIHFTLPSILMMILTSLYTVIDGLFVSNFVGKIEFAGVNLIYPFIMILGSIVFIFSTGGSALVSMMLGKGEKEKANQYFTMIVVFVGLIGIFISVFGIAFVKLIANMLGASAEMLKSCVPYGRILMGFIPIFMLQNVFQSFLIVAEKPKIGLFSTIISGLTNIILDAVFIIYFKWGVAGAALATGIGFLVGALIPAIYFVIRNGNKLKFTKAKFELKTIFKVIINGLSEFVGNVSSSVVSVIFNFELMIYVGENGVAAYGVLMYIQFIFMAIFLGYSIGVSPVIGFNHGANNIDELKNIFKKSVWIMLFSGISMTLIAIVLKTSLAKLFVGYDMELMEITKHAFLIFSFSFMLQGLNIFTSALFTALNDGITSVKLSFIRTFGLQLLCVLILPIFFGLNGIWFSVVIAEVLSVIVSIFYIVCKRKKYQYV